MMKKIICLLVIVTAIAFTSFAGPDFTLEFSAILSPPFENESGLAWGWGLGGGLSVDLVNTREGAILQFKADSFFHEWKNTGSTHALQTGEEWTFFFIPVYAGPRLLFPLTSTRVIESSGILFYIEGGLEGSFNSITLDGEKAESDEGIADFVFGASVGTGLIARIDIAVASLTLSASARYHLWHPYFFTFRVATLGIRI